MARTKPDQTTPTGQQPDFMPHVVRLRDGFHILELTGDTETPIRGWPGPLASRAAAELFRDDLVAAHADGNASDACCSSGLFEFFNIAGRILEIIGDGSDDPQTLARRITEARPWCTPGFEDLEVPF